MTILDARALHNVINTSCIILVGAIARLLIILFALFAHDGVLLAVKAASF